MQCTRVRLDDLMRAPSWYRGMCVRGLVQENDLGIIEEKDAEMQIYLAGKEEAQARVSELEGKLVTQDEAFLGMQAELNALREELIETITSLEERTKGEMAAEDKYREAAARCDELEGALKAESALREQERHAAEEKSKELRAGFSSDLQENVVAWEEQFAQVLSPASPCAPSHLTHS